MTSACIRITSTMSEYFLLLTTVEQNGFCMVPPAHTHTFMAKKIHTCCPSSTWNIP